MIGLSIVGVLGFRRVLFFLVIECIGLVMILGFFFIIFVVFIVYFR